MNLAPPEPGAIIRYAYLWAAEAGRGREEGRKDRPALVLALVVHNEAGLAEVLVLAVTHTKPQRSSDAVAIPASVRRRLGLDDAPAFIITSQANAFFWPGPDIRPIPGRKPPSILYGKVPHALLREAARSFLANRKTQRAPTVRRTS